MNDTPQFKRGDVVLLPLPFVTDPGQRKMRPAVVIQNDIGNRFSPNLLVAAITSKVPAKDYPTNHRLPIGVAGLVRESVVLGSVGLTVPKSIVWKRTGRLDGSDMSAVDDCLRMSLSLGGAP